MRLCLDGERAWGGFPKDLGGVSLTRPRCPVPRELSAGTPPAAAAGGAGSDNVFGKSFYYGASSSGSPEIPGQIARGGSPGALDQPPATSPSHPGGRRRCDALPALAKFRDFHSSRLPLPAPWDKQTRLCLLSPLPLSGRKGHSGKCRGRLWIFLWV